MNEAPSVIAPIPYRTMHELLRTRLLDRWASLVSRRPRVTVVVCLLLAVAGGGLALWKLEFHPDRSDLVAPELPWNARYAAYKRTFPRWGDVIVVLDGDPRDQSIEDLVRRVQNELRTVEGVANADGGFDPVRHPRLFRIAPEGLSTDYPDSFDASLAQLGRLRTIAEAPNVNAALVAMLQGEASAGADTSAGVINGGEGVSRLEALLEPYLRAVGGEDARFSPPGFEQASWQALSTASGRLRMIFVSFEGIDASASGIEAPLRRVRSTVARLLEGHPEVSFGVTGVPAIEADETTQSIRDSTVSSILAVFMISILMCVLFRGVVVPIIAVLALLMGLGWSFGWAVLIVGHLQLLSVVFTVVLLGLGIDFAVYISSRLELVHDRYDGFPEAIRQTFQSVGPGLITGAITTASAFAAIALTDFKGAAEMGLIAGGGILLCLIAIMSAFPAMLIAFGDWRRSIRTHKEDLDHSPLARPLFFVMHHPRATILVCLIGVCALGWQASRLRYDPNILNLQPPAMESVRWEHRLIDDDARSVWAGLAIVEPEAGAERVEQFRALEHVSSIGGMGVLFPPDRDDRQDAIARVRASPVRVPQTPPGVTSLADLLTQVARGLRARSGDDASLDVIAAHIEQAVREGRELADDVRQAAWSSLDASFGEWRASTASFVDRALAPGWIGSGDLPDIMQAQWIGIDGRWLLRVYPVASERSVLAPDRLEAFVAALRSVDPDVLGPPVQIYESSRLIQRAYLQAALFALPIIFFILLFDFRSLVDPLCAMAPVVVGFIGAFGLMRTVGVPLNFANMIVMPVILGIGVDAGVHVVHRWREAPGGRPPGLNGGTGRGILMTTITTMIGFGCMMIAEHRGIRSLGFTMVAGLAMTLLACYTILPSILAMRSMRVARK